MTQQIASLVDRFIDETNMDDIEVEEINEHYYVCTDFRQLGEIHKINDEYCICLDDDGFKGKRYNSHGWA